MDQPADAAQAGSLRTTDADSPVERRLVNAARAGDAAAWEAIVREHQTAVFRLAYLFLADRTEAEDVAQDALIRAYRHLDKFDPERTLRPWLLSIVANLARNRRRSLGRYWAAIQKYVWSEPPPASEADFATQFNRAHDLWLAVRRLRPPEQEIIYLRFFLHLSVDEAAGALQVAPGTVKSRLSRAMQQLRGVIIADFPELLPARLTLDSATTEDM
jgi:RNA polymerase sigma-70 factor (ECF subfamily)